MDVCRVCLSTTPEKDIYALKTTKKQEPKSSFEIFEFCLNIQVNEDSKITKKLCTKCYQKIVQYFKFKYLALKNDKYLQSLSLDSESDPVKSEIISDNDVSNSSFNIENNLKEDDLIEDSTELINDVKDEPLIKAEFTNIDAYYDSDDLLSDFKLETGSINAIEYCPPVENVTQETALTLPKEYMPKSTPTKKTRRGRKKHLIKASKKQVCDECGVAVADLKEHSERHIPIEQRKRLPCQDCDKTFLTYGARHKHYKIKHLGITKTCDICNKKVTCLWAHKARTHEQERLKHECNICKLRCISISALDAHMLVHTKERPFECDVCHKKFRLKMSMQHHIRRVHDEEKAHLCQYCSKSFFKKYHLQVHLRSHTMEKPYKCEECGRAFACSTTLKNHKVTHISEKNFVCELCNMRFVCKDYLRVHMVSHTKEKRFECKYCGIKFGRSDHRKRHQYTAHEKHMVAAGQADVKVPSSYRRYGGKK